MGSLCKVAIRAMVAVGMLFLFAELAQAHVWHVPSACPTIQDGIDSAVVGGVVEVSCGTYYELGIVMKSGITLRSETHNDDCVTIDARVQA
jgi:hypothetical protein